VFLGGKGGKTVGVFKRALSVVAVAALVATGSLVSASAAYAQYGDFDASYGDDGDGTTIVTPASPGDSYAPSALAMQPSGKALVRVASGSNFALVRLTAAGTIDSAFQSGGILALAPLGLKGVVAADATGRFYVSGDGRVGRFLVDGDLDVTFAGDGTADFAVAPPAGTTIVSQFMAGVHVRPSGGVAVVGERVLNAGMPQLLVGTYDESGTRTERAIDLLNPSASLVGSTLAADGRLLVAVVDGFGMGVRLVRLGADAASDAALSTLDPAIFGTVLDIQALGNGNIAVIGQRVDGDAGMYENVVSVLDANGAMLHSAVESGPLVTVPAYVSPVPAVTPAAVDATPGAGFVVAETLWVSGIANVRIRKYAGDGLADTGFSGDGTSNTMVGVAQVISVAPNGTVVAGGAVSPSGGSLTLMRVQNGVETPPTSGGGGGGSGGGGGGSGFAPLSSPQRMLDTRFGIGAAQAEVAAGATLAVAVAGHGGVPADATTVAMNVTVTGAAGDGFATVWPCGQAKPDTSNLNFRAGESIANSVVTGVGTGGAVCFSSSVATDLIADVSGAFGAAVHPLVAPQRLLDTRLGNGAPANPVVAGGVVELQVTGRGGVPVDADSIVLNVTATNTSAAGFVTVWSCGQPQPDTSNLNFEAGATRPNLVVARIGADGKVCLYTSAGADLLADATAWLPVSPAYTPKAIPERVVDTRISHGGPRLAADDVLAFNVLDGLSGVVVNVTAVNPSSDGYLTVWPCDAARPDTSNVNFVAHQAIANLVIAHPSSDGRVCVYTSAGTDLIADVTGTFTGS
jgi:hypothetical protein